MLGVTPELFTYMKVLTPWQNAKSHFRKPISTMPRTPETPQLPMAQLSQVY